MTAETVAQVWTLSLVIFAVVLVVVAVLLTLILREARRIHGGVAQIWNVGQKVANNTIHISLLATTNHLAARILARAAGVVAATGELKAHAEDCPGCPGCVLGRKA
jgi:K+ transporter